MSALLLGLGRADAFDLRGSAGQGANADTSAVDRHRAGGGAAFSGRRRDLQYDEPCRRHAGLRGRGDGRLRRQSRGAQGRPHRSRDRTIGLAVPRRQRLSHRECRGALRRLAGGVFALQRAGDDRRSPRFGYRQRGGPQGQAGQFRAAGFCRSRPRRKPLWPRWA